ncbi:MAG: ATP-dependent Clp protease adaptor ClpS [Crocinitomicaceae bacterium]|nr:ATP-dependent Clp protease adaptor ClpS [Crocinitomicaceae bacterium]MCF8411619.1 ATP-dependent Clp protease adaptor ClpS [Crocinitomicaceae bacterium]MCF8444509.1 ATP-dependent Clp protease adaptor ClpS [Crocinitomicaceae bacterium]
MNNTKTQEQDKFDVLEELIDENGLILYNDDVNTFDHVINSLVKICKHEPIQAEQCAWIVHLNGKCKVKNGNFEELEPMCVALLDRGISATIE